MSSGGGSLINLNCDPNPKIGIGSGCSSGLIVSGFGYDSIRYWNGGAGSTSYIGCDREIDDDFDLYFGFRFGRRYADKRRGTYSNWSVIFINDQYQ